MKQARSNPRPQWKKCSPVANSLSSMIPRLTRTSAFRVRNTYQPSKTDDHKNSHHRSLRLRRKRLLYLRTKKNVRLLLSGERSHPRDTPFEVGQIWEMTLYSGARRKPPHVEDVIIKSQNFVSTQPDMSETLLQHIQPWTGELILSCQMPQ